MYDTGKIIAGVIIFLILFTFPIWYSQASGEASSVPEPQIPADKEQCVEPADWMRVNHMKLLLRDWQPTVVRGGGGPRTYIATDGKEFDMSLTNTCMDCHSNKAEFCDQCHTYVGIAPGCWDCHNEPGGSQTDGN